MEAWCDGQVLYAIPPSSRSDEHQVRVHYTENGRSMRKTLAVDDENLITSGEPEQYVLWRPAEGTIDEVEEYGEDEFEAQLAKATPMSGAE